MSGDRVVERGPRRRAISRRDARGIGLAAVLVLAGGTLLVLAAVRIGTEKLVPSTEIWRTQTAHGTWHRMFDLDGVATAISLPLWAFALIGAGVIGFPYAWLAARALPDAGYALSRVVGLLLVTWMTWWISSLRLLDFGRLSIVAATAVVGAGAVWIAIVNRGELGRWLRARWRLALAAELVFWALFLLALYVRWSNPDLWHPTRGGEKPMDFAYLNAVVKSTSFPPYDPWFAGGQMNYYYYGFVQVAALAKLTGIPPAIAYNLAVPTLAGLLGSASFGAALGLFPRGGRLRGPVAVAALGALLVTAFGNLGEARVLRAALNGTVPNDWWFWNASRVIHPGEGEPGPITEFPAFTFIYGDLHAHAMALPLAALVVALTVAVARRPGRLRGSAAALALLAPALGALWVTNTWDLPTYALVVLCGIAIATVAEERSRRTLAAFAAGAGAVLAAAYLAYLPFHLHYFSVFEGVQRWEGTQTRLFDYLTVHGLFLFAIVSGLVAQLALAPDLGSVARVVRLGAHRPRRARRLVRLHRAAVRPRAAHLLGLGAVSGALVAAAVCAVVAQWPAAVALLVGTLATLAWPVEAHRGVGERERALRRLLVVFVLVGLALTTAVEYVVLRNVDIGRTNTVFKLYLQVWLLWALATASSVGTMYGLLPRLPRALREPWRLVFVALLAVAALYPVLAARAKIADRFDRTLPRTLDGSAFMRTAVARENEVSIPLAPDGAAIRWVLEHLDGTHVFAEANTAPVLYGWEARYAVFTGNPTVVGWDFHQRQQRPPMAGEVQRRVTDVRRAYRTIDPGVAYHLLDDLGAEYVVVGPLEHAYFPEGEQKWARGVGRYWTVAYGRPGVRIYRLVRRDTS